MGEGNGIVKGVSNIIDRESGSSLSPIKRLRPLTQGRFRQVEQRILVRVRAPPAAFPPSRPMRYWSPSHTRAMRLRYPDRRWRKSARQYRWTCSGCARYARDHCHAPATPPDLRSPRHRRAPSMRRRRWAGDRRADNGRTAFQWTGASARVRSVRWRIRQGCPLVIMRPARHARKQGKATVPQCLTVYGISRGAARSPDRSARGCDWRSCGSCWFWSRDVPLPQLVPTSPPIRMASTSPTLAQRGQPQPSQVASSPSSSRIISATLRPDFDAGFAGCVIDDILWPPLGTVEHEISLKVFRAPVAPPGAEHLTQVLECLRVGWRQ